MKILCVCSSYCLFAVATLAASSALAIDPLQLPAEDPGQADLDKATQMQITASKMVEFSGVIALCETAKKKGLDAGNVKVADGLIASALQERGARYAELAFARMLRSSRLPSGTGAKTVDKNGKNGETNPPADSWQDDRKAALADLERSVTLSPKQPRALFFIARLNMLPEGNAARAVKALDGVVELADDARLKAEALLLRANVGKDGQQRLADLDEAVRLTPGETGALRARAASRAEHGKFDAALDDIQKALEIDPKEASSYQIKALILVNEKKFDEAMKTLEKARVLVPENADVLVTMARVAIAKGDSKTAVESLDKALVLAPNSVELRGLRAELFRELGDRKKVLAEVDKMLELRPEFPGLLRERAVVLAEMGKPEEAIVQFEKLHDANPNDALTQMQLGLLYTTVKKYRKAVELLSTLLAAHPDEWIAYRTRADAYLNMGHRDKAVVDYDKALRLRPGDVGILNNLAWILATAPEKQLRDGKRAVDLATDACKRTEYKEDYILSTLAAAYAEQGNFDTAKKWAEKAVEVSTKARGDELKKELQSYVAKKPWREALPDDDKKPEAADKPSSGGKEKPVEDKSTGDKPRADKTTGGPISDN